MKMIRFASPSPYHDDRTLVTTMLPEDAIREQRQKALDKGREYRSDEQALDDFIVVNWAEVINVGE